MENIRKQQVSGGRLERTVSFVEKSFLLPYREYRQTETGLMVVVFTLFIIGIAYLFSISAYTVLIGTSNATLLDPTKNVDIFGTAKSQLLNGLLGIVLMFFSSFVNPDIYRKLAYLIFAIMTVGLGAVCIGGQLTGQEFARSVPIPGLFSFQPSEIAKLSLIFYLAVAAEQDYYRLNDLKVPKNRISIPYKRNEEDDMITSLRLRTKALMKNSEVEIYNPAKGNNNAVVSALRMLFVVCMFAGLVVLGNHVSGAIVIAVIGIVMILLSYSNAKVKLITLSALILLAGMFAIFYFKHEAIENLGIPIIGNIASKIYGRFHVSDNVQVVNALTAIGRGGLTGVGFGQSMMKRFYVPVLESDMIFSIICEEGGLLMAAFICFLYGAFAYYAIKVMNKCDRLRDRYIIIGIVTHFLFQVIVHIGVNLSIFPNTGMILPFISKGGSSLWIQFAEVGIIMGIARKNYAEGRRRA